MRSLLYLACLSALAAAVPQPQVETGVPVSISLSIATPTISVVESTSLNIPITAVTTTTPVLLPTDLPGLNLTSTSRRRRPSHWEPVPIFSKKCDCPDLATMAYPCWATDRLERCNFEELHSWVCWTSANFGCPTPTRQCSDLFTAVPLTGKHPCDLGPGFAPEPTAAPVRH